VEPKDLQLLGRVSLARTVRLDALGAAAPVAAAPEPQSADVLCPGGGASLCEASRRALFVGMVLRCTCGEKTRVAQVP